MSPTCKLAQRWISLKVDGEPLPEGADRRLDEHLVACARCRNLLREETERAASLRRTLSSPPGSLASLAHDVLAATSARAPTARPAPYRSSPQRRWGLAAAAAVLLGVGLWMFSSSIQPLMGPDEEDTPAITEIRPAPSRPLSFFFQEDRWDVDPVAGDDGTRYGRKIRTTRELIGEELLRAIEDGKPAGSFELWIERERVRTDYIQHRHWPYH